MRLLAIVIALVISGAAGHYTHNIFSTPLAASIDIAIFIIVFIIVDRSIKSYLDE